MKSYKVRNEANEEFEVSEDKLHEAEADGFLPVASNGNEEFRVSSNDFDKAAKDGFKPVYTSDKGKLESLARGAGQGASLGFIDEAVGAAKAFGNDMSDMFGFTEGPKVEVKRDEFGRVSNPKELDPGYYEKYRDEYRSEDSEAQEANPGSYMGGQVIGGVATAPLGANLIKGGSKLAQAVKLGAAEGGLYGLGESEGESITDVALDGLKGAALGSVGGVVGSKVGDVVEGGMKKVGSMLEKATPADKLSKVAGNVLFDLPSEYTEALVKNPGAKARGFDEIEDALVEGVNSLRTRIGKADTLAWETLSSEKKLIGKPFASMVDGILDEANVVGSTFRKDKLAQSKADEILAFIKDNPVLSESDLKKIIQKIDAETDWDRMELDTANKVLQQVRSKFDQFLKNRNPAYKAEMAEVAPLVNQLQKTVKDMRLIKAGDGYGATDTTMSKMKNLFDGKGEVKRPHAAENLGKLEDGLLDEMKLRHVLDRTDAGVANGSRNVFTGGVTGAASGGIPGMVAGTIAGYAKDKYGRKAGKSLLQSHGGKIQGIDDGLQSLGQKMGQLPGKYRQVMEDAARRGGNALAVSHFLLGQSDPEYQRHIKGEDDE